MVWLDDRGKARNKSWIVRFGVHCGLTRVVSVSHGQDPPQKQGQFAGRSVTSLAIGPSIDIGPNLILFDPVALLELALTLIGLASDTIEVIVGEVAPLFFSFACLRLPWLQEKHSNAGLIERKTRAGADSIRVSSSVFVTR